MSRRFMTPIRFALAVAVLGSLAGCDTLSNMNPFTEKDTPLPGERRPVPRVTAPPPDNVPQPLSALPDLGDSRLA